MAAIKRVCTWPTFFLYFQMYCNQKLVFSFFLSVCFLFKINHQKQKCYQGQKHLSIGVLRKRCSENVQQIYRRASMSKCDFSKVALQFFFEIRLWYGCSPVNLLHIFKTPFYKNTYGGLLLQGLLKESFILFQSQLIVHRFYWTK